MAIWTGGIIFDVGNLNSYPFSITLFSVSFVIWAYSIVVLISECPRKCKNCQTPFLQESTGEELTVDYLKSLVQTIGEHATNVVFLGMGDDSDVAKKEFIKLATWIREETDKKVTLYTGSNVLDWDVVDLLGWGDRRWRLYD